MPTYLQAKIISNTNIAGNFYQLFLAPQEKHSFLPGQYIIIKINDERVAQYSLASAPKEENFELLVDVTPDGVSSRYLKSRQSGDSIEYLPPMGRFILRDDASEDIVFFATGSGIAPFKSMIPTLLDQKKQKICLRFGLRHNSDIFYHDYFTRLSQEYSHFRYQLFLSQPDSDFPGLTGHITHDIQTLIEDAQKTSAYLCGSPNMIQEAEQLLLKLQVPQNKIYYEKFWK